MNKLTQYILKGFAICLILLIGYVLWNIFFYKALIIPFGTVNKDEIVKRTLHKHEIENEYIIGNWVAQTGYDYRLIRNEKGEFSRKLVRVTGVTPKVTYEFLTINTFILYVEEKKEYYDTELGENVVEYVVNGWDVLYPAKHDDTPITSIPKYVLKRDISNK